MAKSGPGLITARIVIVATANSSCMFNKPKFDEIGLMSDCTSSQNAGPVLHSWLEILSFPAGQQSAKRQFCQVQGIFSENL
jgi:hypothetical protein